MSGNIFQEQQWNYLPHPNYRVLFHLKLMMFKVDIIPIHQLNVAIIETEFETEINKQLLQKSLKKEKRTKTA